MSVKVKELMPGDVICCLKGKDSAHSAIFVGTMTFEGDEWATIVHADPPHLICEPVDALEDYEPVVFRCGLSALAAKASVYAREWAREDSDDKGATKYVTGEPGARGHGVVRGTTPEFGYDALYRSVKWAGRLSSPNGDGVAQAQLSKNRGTTCCAVVASCYQAAALNNFSRGDLGKLRDAEDFLKTFRGQKDPSRMDMVPSRSGKLTDEGLVKTGAYNRSRRDLTNAGFKYKDGPFKLSDYFRVVLEALKPTHETRTDLTPAGLFTAPMAVDAKFYYSNMLYQNLKLSEQWTSRGKLALELT